MICNRVDLLHAAPIVGMITTKQAAGGTTYGLGEAGYDIRIKQRVVFGSSFLGQRRAVLVDGTHNWGRFALASAIEEFEMPTNLVGIVHDKSTWARRGLSVFNTVIEPGWRGFLTLELVYHGDGHLVIPAGSGIAQVVFHHTSREACYEGRYQDQANAPIEAKDA